ncbi:flavin reductase family protein [Phaeobacter sp. J2-8]|uniref:flavin reductase family protein n=1 Tax=Phaeobacter sp. J2-8 TaxID=2931394 RepID=UPI001FD20C5A|nr:flavin reductase family protein [Phaeobacter sp. J2-8]MCJ7874055.1 flavin reductase family protein [Phaeobacter sp. J2-8]
MNAMTHFADMDRHFSPALEDPRALRDAFGKFATGVTIITCNSDEGPVCITANSFSSLSLDPALVMWAAGVTSRRFPYFREAQHYAVHVLSAEQTELCFACSRDAFALRDLPHATSASGVPLLAGCLARFECDAFANHPAGDHRIFVGQVTNVGITDGDALAFYAGKFGEMADQ